MMPQTYPHYIPSVPYTSPSNPLQTLDIWLSRPLNASPPSNTVWIIYVHGGAWRDPLQDKSELEPALKHLHESNTRAIDRIAGFASLNYRLSPNVQHPIHVRDVALALDFLRKEYALNEYRWMGIGHSCGATLLTQLVSGIGLHGTAESGALSVGKPCALVLLAGIYDMPLFMRNHTSPKVEEDIEKIYREILEGAFGKDEQDWKAASPVVGKFDGEMWPEGRLVVLGQSEDDGLVEVEQVEVMEKVLKREGWEAEREKNCLRMKKLKGEHDFVWEDGKQIAELIEEAIVSLIQKLGES